MSTTRRSSAASKTTAAKKTTPRKTAAKPVAPEEPEDETTVATADATVADQSTVDDAPESDATLAHTRAALEKHGISADGIPEYNPFFAHGFIRVRGGEYGLVTELNLWPSTAVRDEVLAAYRKDRA